MFVASILALLLALMLAVAAAPPAQAAPGGWTVDRLTDNGVDDTVPSIDGTTMVWQQDTDAHAEIWARNLPTGVVTRITNNTVEDANPDISPKYMVWERPDGGDSDIFLRVRSTGVVTQVSNDADDDHFPRVSGETVVWEHDWPMMDIQEYDIFQGTLDGVVGFGPGWDPWAPATRAEVAQIIWGVRNAIRPYPEVATATP